MAKPVPSTYARNRAGKPIKLRIGEKAERKIEERQVPVATITCNELDRIFSDRYRAQLPDDDAGRDDAEIMLNQIAHRTGVDPELLMDDWLDRKAPFIAGEEREAMIARVLANPRRYKADPLAAKIGLTYADRQRLKITRIGSIDILAAERKKIRKRKNKERQTKRRREEGRMTRQEYEKESLSKTKPWEVHGISKSTYYRLIRKAEKSGKSQYAAHGLVSPVMFAIVTVRPV